MGYMFFNSTGATNINLLSFDTSKVTNMECMFRECRKVDKIDLSNFDTSQVITIDRMFENVTAPVKIGEKWNKTTMTEEATGYSGSFSI